MSRIYIKQSLKLLAAEVLTKQLLIKSPIEVDRYSYATKLGTLEHIDYAIPLFGYAREAAREVHEIYKLLTERITADLPCRVEFVNGYMNIMLDNSYLKEALVSHHEDEPDLNVMGEKVKLVLAATDRPTEIAAELVHESLTHIGVKSEKIPALPADQTSTGQYAHTSAKQVRQLLSAVPGVVFDADSKAAYVQLGDEHFALRAAKGGWYAPALALATIKKELDKGQRVFVLGNSDLNQLVRGIFTDINSLDVDVHARHLDESFRRSLAQLLHGSKQSFQADSIGALISKQRQELLYALDYEYEVSEAVKSGDLKRLLGEITNLMRLHPLPDVAGNE